MEKTFERDLPDEVRFLEPFDPFALGIQGNADMPTAQIELLQKFLAQNGGRLSQRAQTREFAALTQAEAERVERLYAETFGEG